MKKKVKRMHNENNANHKSIKLDPETHKRLKLFSVRQQITIGKAVECLLDTIDKKQKAKGTPKEKNERKH